MSPTELIVEVDGHPTQVLRGGDGPALVFLHSGLGESWWADWADHLARDRTVFIPSHPGFGRSEGWERIQDMEDLAFHYDALFRHLGLESFVLIGQSLGGWIAAEYAVRWPERVEHLVLLNSSGLRVEGSPVPDMFRMRPPEIADRLFSDPQQPIAVMLRSFDAEQPPDESVLVPFVQAQQAAARLAWNPYLHDPKLAGRLGRISCPTLVVWGSDDGLMPLAHGEEYARLIPDARVRTVEGAGNLPLLERPRETLDLVEPFLA